MKAIRIHEFGGPEVLKYEEVPQPQISDDEVLIKVYASSVNPIDWKIREGKSKERFPVNLPLTIGWDVSGVVEKTGCAISRFKKGDEVYGRPYPIRNGAFAEYVAVKENEISRKPLRVTHEEAAAAPLTCLTAWQGLFDHGQLQKGQKVLIHAASGGVGTFAVQLARWKGAYVIGTASENNIDFVKQLGADEVIDYKKEKFEDMVHEADLVFDTVGGDTQKKSLQVIKNGGRLITTVKPENQEAAKAKNIHIEGYTAQSYTEQLQQIAGLIDEGVIKIFVAASFTLEQAADAERQGEQGHTRGKIVLKVVQ